MSSAAPRASGPLLGGLRRLVGPRVGLLHMHEPRPLRAPPARAPAEGAALSVTLVTPVRNQAAFIGAALDSVLGQAHPRLEYVVMDGASTDGTREAIEARAPRLARWVSARDGGQSDAIQRGFEGTQGEIMGWLNGDDVLLPGALAEVTDHFARNPGVDVIYGNRVLVDEQGREVGRWVLAGGAHELLDWLDVIPQETMFWRRSAWEKAGGRVDTGLRFAMDWELLTRLRRAGARFLHLPRFLGAFRVHSAQKTHAEIGAAGFAEMDRIRERCLGRRPGRARIALAVAPWMARQVAADLAWRLRGTP